jgi:hypothetical protein
MEIDLMVWKLNEQLFGGELSNEVRGLVTGFLIFRGMAGPVILRLKGNFHRDIRGATIKLFGMPDLTDEEQAKEYLEHFSSYQTGCVGDITAGMEPFDFANYPYIEWYSYENGRVLLELLPEQLRVVGKPFPWTSEIPTDPEDSREHNRWFLDGVAQVLKDDSHSKP